MPRETAPVTQNQYGSDTHPAFGWVSVNTHSSTPGQVLFDSDVRHGTTVVLSVGRATRSRSNNHDYIHGDSRDLVEIEMSSAQWAALVSSFGSSGVPCTIRRTENQVDVPGLEYAPRLAISMAETHTAAARAFGEVMEALTEYERVMDPTNKAGAKEKREALHTLRIRIQNATPNVDFAGKTLAKHAEAVVTKAQADIETIVQREVTRLGAVGAIEPGSVTLGSLGDGGDDPLVIEG